MQPKVLVVIVTKDLHNMQCAASVNNQNYDNYNVLQYTRSNEQLHPDPVVSRSKNIAINRMQAKRLALGSDAQYFLMVDSDLTLPSNTIANLVRHRRHLVGGWYYVRGDRSRWVAGNWINEGPRLHQYQEVQPGLLAVDYVGLGCMMLSRELYAQAEFMDGWNIACLHQTSQQPGFAGPCVAFGLWVKERGYQSYADGSVVCSHAEPAPRGFSCS